MKTSFAGLVGLAGVLALATFTPPLAGFKVVVNPANAITTVPVKQLADLYLKRTVQWQTGLRVQAVDLPGNSPVRNAF